MMAWTGGFTTQSNFARAAADAVAEAASRGWIITRLSPEVYGRRWFISITGLIQLTEHLNGDLQ